MSKRLLGSVLFASAFTLLLLVAALVIASSSNQAQAALASAPSHVSGPGLVPNAAWVDIAAFPAVTYSPTPGAATAAKLKRAGAAAYPPNGKVYLLGGRN